jgi:hypothetical protein
MIQLVKPTFCSQYFLPCSQLMTVTSPRLINPNDKLCNVYFSTNIVKNGIKKLRANSIGGPDGLPPVFLKTCSSQLSISLAYIYNQCMEQGYLAPDWLRAYIMITGTPPRPHPMLTYLVPHTVSDTFWCLCELSVCIVYCISTIITIQLVIYM